MKKLFTLTIALATMWSLSSAQNVGVDVATPEQKLDVAGGIKIGNTSNGVAGSLLGTEQISKYMTEQVGFPLVRTRMTKYSM